MTRKILLVYPAYPPNTYWSFGGAMSYIGRRAAMPPLGLITVAALLPSRYKIRLVDMNVEPLRDDDLYWADLVLTSTMIVQADSLAEVIRRAHRAGVPVAAGGPHPSSVPNGIPGVDHLIAGEAEAVLPRFLADLEAGVAASSYRASELPPVAATPVPRFDLLDLDAYASMAVQFSRGCPFSCDFCDIWRLYGRRPRVKENGQLLAELDSLYEAGWRRSVFIVDDNFIGHPARAKGLLGDLARWQREHGHPFDLYTEASVNLAGDDELLHGMRDAGFSMVFLGIETPSIESLECSNKKHNLRTNLMESVHKIQEAGIEVAGGFIVGFDGDTEDIFERQERFIEAAGIPMAMVGILTAVPGTDLHDRLQKEGRLLSESGGNNTHTFQANFEPRMPAEKLAEGYRDLIHGLYDRRLKSYFRRCRTLLRRWAAQVPVRRRVGWRELRALARAIGTFVSRPYGRQFARFLLWTAGCRPHRLGEAVRLGIMGFHFQEITHGSVSRQTLRADYARESRQLRERVASLPSAGPARDKTVHDLYARRLRLLGKCRRRIRRLPVTFRPDAEADYAAFLAETDRLLFQIASPSHRARFGGSDLLDEIRTFLEKEEAALSRRYRELRERATRGMEDLNVAARALYEERRRKLREARQRLRRLPSEYRDIARREYEMFRFNLALMTL